MSKFNFKAALREKVEPGGYLVAPINEERVGDVSNVVFCNGTVLRNNGDIFIYYASSHTRCHVATSSVERLLDYVINTPEDPLRSRACVEQRQELISRNLDFLKSLKGKAAQDYAGI